jgi:hydroxyacylglutathione hydrolase
VTETHIHADYVSDARELAAHTGAQLYVSDMGPAEWKYANAADAGARLLGDGDRFMVGNVRIEVLHIPGHTPKHLAFLVTDTAHACLPLGLVSGDFVFVGDVGRPDLPTPTLPDICLGQSISRPAMGCSAGPAGYS